MATLDDRLLGEKLENYCSSSEEEEEEEREGDGERDEGIGPEMSKHGGAQQPVESWNGSAVNCGPKGVMQDWRRFKQLQAEERRSQEAEKLALIKKLSLTCRTEREDEQAKQKEEELDQDIAEFLNDEFLQEYMQKRMTEMYSRQQSLPNFGRLFSLSTGQEFLDAIDNERKDVTIIVHLYEQLVESCEAMNGCLACLAQEYPSVKFFKLKASAAGVSKHFKATGIPALLVYRGGQLIGNFVRLGDEFGEDFFAVDVEAFLIENGMISDKSLVPSLIRENAANRADSGDSDFDVE